KRRKRASTTGTSRPSPRELGIMRKDDTSASFLGSSSGIHFVRTVYHAFARRSADLQQARASHESLVPGEDDHLRTGQGQAHAPLWTSDELDPTNPKLPFEDLVQLSRHYFLNWHPIYPFIHAPHILRAMEQTSQGGLRSISRTDAVLIRSIMSMAAIDSRQARAGAPVTVTVPAELVFQTVHEAMNGLRDLLDEPSSIPLLQAAFSIQLFLTSILRLNAASRIGGFVTRTAFHLGLHRCPARYSCFTAEDVATRRRLFWSIYCLERYLTQALGVPLSIRDDDLDVCYPGAERHASDTEVVLSQPEDRRLKLLRHLAKFARLRGLISELRNKSIMHSGENVVEAVEVSSALLQWWNEVYDDVFPLESEPGQGQGQGHEAGLQPFHSLLLVVSRHEAKIALHRPLLAADNSTTADYKAAFHTCINSSRSLLAALHAYISAPPSDNRPPLVVASFTWTVWMSCLILIYAAWTGHFSNQGALRYARIGIAVLQNIARREREWPQTCIEAIEDLCSALERQERNSTYATTGSTGNAARRPQPEIPSDCPDAIRIAEDPITFPGHANNNHGDGNGNASPHSVRNSMAQDSWENLPMSAPGFDPTSVLTTPDLYNAASMVFGDLAGSGFSYGLGPESTAALPASDPFMMNEGWSVADGPWLIHGDFNV
ncbi:CeGAL family transcription factor, partial [Aspergillus homomorphus CBS 101889]